MLRYNECCKRCVQNALKKEKKIMPPAGFKLTTSRQLLYRLSCSFQRNVAQVFSITFTLQSERNHSWTCGKKLWVGGWWALHVRHLMNRTSNPMQVIGVENRKAGFSALYIDMQLYLPSKYGMHAWMEPSNAFIEIHFKISLLEVIVQLCKLS